MEKLSINLLPPEFTAEEVKRAKFYKVQILGVSVILFVAFLASLTIALRILQTHNIRQVEAQVSEEEQRVNNLKDRQASLLILKNRLTAINQYLGVSSQQSAIFKLVSEFLPQSMTVSSLSIDRLGQMLISAVVPDVLTLDEFILSLTTKDKNQDEIAQVSIESLNRGKDGIYRLSLKIKPKFSL